MARYGWSAAGLHLEDQLSSEKKCGHMGGKVLLPTAAAIRNLIAARLADHATRDTQHVQLSWFAARSKAKSS